MSLYKKKNGELIVLTPIQPPSESFIQRLFERNLKLLLELYFIASEFRIANGRIDTLAIDTDDTPVIIEFKLTRDQNVIGQALSYRKGLLMYDALRLQSLIEKQLPQEVREGMQIDLRNPRIICVAESFSHIDIDMLDAIGPKVELYQYKLFDEDLLALEPVLGEARSSHPNSAWAGSVESSDAIIQGMKEQNRASDAISDIFNLLRARIMGLDLQVTERTTKRTVNYRLSKNFAEVLIRSDHIVIDLRPIDYTDPRGMVEYRKLNYTVTMNRRVVLSSLADLDYVFGLIEQSYRNVL